MPSFTIKHFILGSPASHPSKFDNFFHGQGIDLREIEPKELTLKLTKNSFSFSFDHRKREFVINGTSCFEATLDRKIRSLSIPGSVLVDGTTLNPVELAALFKSLIAYGKRTFYVRYYEPKTYAHDPADVSRSFLLSQKVNAFQAAPYFSYELTDDSHFAMFFVGYEGQRLERAFDQLPLRPRNTKVCFGVPAFNAGWENNAIANNVSILIQRKLTHETFYAGANSVIDTFELLKSISTKVSSSKRLFVIPIGTKPHGIAAALFANHKDQIGMFYDFPEKKKGRTSDLGKGHLFQITATRT